MYAMIQHVTGLFLCSYVTSLLRRKFSWSEKWKSRFWPMWMTTDLLAVSRHWHKVLTRVYWTQVLYFVTNFVVGDDFDSSWPSTRIFQYSSSPQMNPMHMWLTTHIICRHNRQHQSKLCTNSSWSNIYQGFYLRYPYWGWISPRSRSQPWVWRALSGHYQPLPAGAPC